MIWIQGSIRPGWRQLWHRLGVDNKIARQGVWGQRASKEPLKTAARMTSRLGGRVAIPAPSRAGKGCDECLDGAFKAVRSEGPTVFAECLVGQPALMVLDLRAMVGSTRLTPRRGTTGYSASQQLIATSFEPSRIGQLWFGLKPIDAWGAIRKIIGSHLPNPLGPIGAIAYLGSLRWFSPDSVRSVVEMAGVSRGITTIDDLQNEWQAG